eukprot:1160693-Pelagomonas_calceolata.AAC.5
MRAASVSFCFVRAASSAVCKRRHSWPWPCRCAGKGIVSSALKKKVLLRVLPASGTTLGPAGVQEKQRQANHDRNAGHGMRWAQASGWPEKASKGISTNSIGRGVTIGLFCMCLGRWDCPGHEFWGRCPHVRMALRGKESSV